MKYFKRVSIAIVLNAYTTYIRTRWHNSLPFMVIPSVWRKQNWCRKQRETLRKSGSQRRMPSKEIRWGKAITSRGGRSWAVCDDCVCCCSHCTNNKFKQWPPKEPHRWPCLFNFCHHCVFFAACCLLLGWRCNCFNRPPTVRFRFCFCSQLFF